MNIIILGGGCYGLQYTRRLMLAHARGKISVGNVEVVDRNPNCRVAREGLVCHSEQKAKNPAATNEKTIQVVASEWVPFLVKYINNVPLITDDLIVPSHAAPHILGHAFLELIKSSHSPLWKRGVGGDFHSVELADIPHPIGTPFERKLEKGVVAASMATWKCPANCPEPLTCPHFHTKRSWDLEEMLKKWSEKSGFDAFYVFPAHHFAYAVSTIPANNIINAWLSLKQMLKKPGSYTVGIATSSACHAIVSTFRIT
jgi:hypothetical protein